jgi:predicted GNAT family N-acyltransferase
LAEDIPKNQRRKLDGLSKNADSLNVYLIGQLAKNDNYKDQVTGAELLNYAIPLIKNCMKIIGGRVVLVECKNQEKLVDFYKKQDFTKLQETEDTKNMIQLVQTLK